MNTDIYSTIARAALGDAGRVRLVHIRGYAPQLGSHEMTVGSRGGRHVFRDESAPLFIRSTSSDDVETQRAARAIKVYGLDAAGLEINEALPLRGAPGIRTEKPFFRVNGAEVINAGSFRINTGDISIGDQGLIARNIGRLTQAVYTVPVGYEALIMRVSIASFGKKDGATWHVRADNNVIDWGSIHNGEVSFDHPQALSAGTDIEVTGQSMGADTNMRAALDVVLFPRG